MSEIYNYSPEFVSGDELLVLADYYTSEIKKIDFELSRFDEGSKNTVEYIQFRKAKFRLMQRRYYIRICHRARAAKAEILYCDYCGSPLEQKQCPNCGDAQLSN